MTHEHWLDKPKNIQKVWRGFLLVLALTVVAELFVELHPHFEIEHWMGFNAAYGFITCLLMIVGAKLLGWVLKRPDTHYESDTRHD